ncbi:MAG: biopolymer transporter ExbD [Pirellulaceae bacterium]|nr:biopolymer transporter ExbD [Pirellulaceae bacterium]
MHSPNLLSGSSSGSLLAAQIQHQDDHSFDVTAMVDVVSLMNIYFLITFVGAAMGLFDLPPATHCKALDPDRATIFTVLRGSGETVEVYFGDGKQGAAVISPEEQEERIAEDVRAAIAQGKPDVLFKADKSIRLRDTRRLARAASQEGSALHFSVEERVK